MLFVTNGNFRILYLIVIYQTVYGIINNVLYIVLTGHCYDQVRAETKKLRESMNQDEYRYNHPQKEVSYVYKDDDKYHPSYNGRYLVEIEENRPSWFPNVLTKKHKGEKD